MSQEDEHLDSLRRGLTSENPHERAEAALGVAEAGDLESRPKLESLAVEPNDMVAAAAIFARWLLTSETRDLHRLSSCLESKDEETMQLAVMAFTGLADAGVEALEALLTEGSPRAEDVAWLLSDIGTEGAIAALKRVADSPDAVDREVARGVLEEGDEGSS